MTKELIVQTHEQIQLDEDSSSKINVVLLEKQSDDIVSSVFNLDAHDLKLQKEKAVAIRELGAKVQREMCRRSALLKRPMTKLVSDAEDGGDVATAIIALAEHGIERGGLTTAGGACHQ